jgi:hypothetical protein
MSVLSFASEIAVLFSHFVVLSFSLYNMNAKRENPNSPFCYKTVFFAILIRL